jgi:2-polyprenyl-3-methyl-5-hydroxy-6-metoxy-1,4-benzoquinol methylase
MIVDLGCGSGVLLRTLGELGYRRLTGVDVSGEQAVLASAVASVRIETRDLRQFLENSPGDGYDVVFAFDVLEHFNKEEVLQILEGVRRILRPRGRLIAHVPNGEGPFGARSFFWDATHETGWTRASAGQMAAAAGFVSFNAYEDTPVPHGPVSLARALLWQAFRLWWRFVLAVETGDISSQIILSQNLLFVCERD